VIARGRSPRSNLHAPRSPRPCGARDDRSWSLRGRAAFSVIARGVAPEAISMHGDRHAPAGLAMTDGSHCEERSDEAISSQHEMTQLSYIHSSSTAAMLDVELTAMFTKQFYVYILTNKNHTVLYTGITNDLQKRTWEHEEGLGSKFN